MGVSNGLYTLPNTLDCFALTITWTAGECPVHCFSVSCTVTTYILLYINLRSVRVFSAIEDYTSRSIIVPNNEQTVASVPFVPRASCSFSSRNRLASSTRSSDRNIGVLGWVNCGMSKKQKKTVSIPGCGAHVHQAHARQSARDLGSYSQVYIWEKRHSCV